MAYQALLGSSATALPATGGAADHVSPVPPSLAPSSGYPPGHDSALVTRYFLVTISFSAFSFFQHFFLMFERFVREGGDADLALYFESLVPDMLAYLNPDLDPDEPEKVPLRKRRSGPQRAAEHKREHEALLLKQAQEHKVVVASKETIGFQVPLLICY